MDQGKVIESSKTPLSVRQQHVSHVNAEHGGYALAGSIRNININNRRYQHFHFPMQKGRLSASFFFSGGGGDLASAGSFATTITAQLAHAIPELRQPMNDAVASNLNIHDLGLYDQ